MNIDCVVEEVDIRSECIQKMDQYESLGTQAFFNSVTSITIDYFNREKSVFEDLEVAHKYFINLKYVNLNCIKDAPLSYIM